MSDGPGGVSGKGGRTPGGIPPVRDAGAEGPDAADGSDGSDGSDARCVRDYLEALEVKRRTGGRRRNLDAIETRIRQIDSYLGRADPVSRVHMIQERINLRRQLQTGVADAAIAALEDEFVRVAAAYGRRCGLTWAAWRVAGVSAAVLRRAAIRPGTTTDAH